MPIRISRFVLLLLSVLASFSALAQDVKRFEVLKGIHYYQVQEGAAFLQTNNAYRFSAQVWADVVGDVLASSVYTSKSDRLDLLPETDGDPFRYKKKFDVLFDLENNYPDGSYTLALRTLHDGDRSMAFNLTGQLYPAAPVFDNYDATQALPFNEYNEFSWQSFAGATTNDFIQLQIQDMSGNTVWETADYTENGALNGFATRTILPAGTLTPGTIYTGTLLFVKVVQNAARSYPLVHGTVGYFARTEFPVRPVSTGLNPLIDRVQLWRTVDVFQDAINPDATTPLFISRVDPITSNQVAKVTLTRPDNASVVLTTNRSYDRFDLIDPALQLYTSGPYDFTFVTFDKTTNHAVINFPSGGFSQKPRIQNISSFVNHSATQDLVVAWLPWTNALPADFIRVEFLEGGNKIWDTASYSSPKHLSTDVTSVTIPATNMVPGHTYTVQVHFYHVAFSDSRVIPGAFVFGGFDSRASARITTPAPDVTAVSVTESQSFFERTEDVFEPGPLGPFRFEAAAYPGDLSAIQSALLSITNHADVTLASDPSAQFLTYNATESSAESLTADYPTGNYQFHFNTQNDGARNVTVSFTNQLPPLPNLHDFSKYRVANLGNDFTNQWDAWPGMDPTTDSAILTLKKFPSGGALFEDSTSKTNELIIPGGALEANKTYVLNLRFQRTTLFNSFEYPGVTATNTVYSEVSCYLTTLQQTNFMAATPVRLPSGDFKFAISNLLAGRTYTFSFSQDLVNWTPITRTIGTGNLPRLTFTNAPLDRQFFRAELLP